MEHQYDELYVTAEFDTGEISGYIDHLIITPDAYHIIDYKTGDITPDELNEDAEYYATQMKAYATALNQQHTGRSVRVSLVFTALADAWEVEWTPEQVDSIRSEIATDLTDRTTSEFETGYLPPELAHRYAAQSVRFVGPRPNNYTVGVYPNS